MDNQTCDRHPSARAQARMILASGSELYLCGHCARTVTYDGEYTIEYETVTV